MTSVTVSLDQLIGWVIMGYAFLHIIFGLVTHYHSVWQVRKHNANLYHGESHHRKIGARKVFLLFFVRMAIGFPWFVVSRLISPIGNNWHWGPEEIATWW